MHSVPVYVKVFLYITYNREHNFTLPWCESNLLRFSFLNSCSFTLCLTFRSTPPDEWCTTVYATWPDPRSSQGEGHVSLKVRNSSIFKIYLVRHFQWELANDCWFFNYRTISKFDRAGILMSVHCPSFLCHVTLSLDQLGSKEESTDTPARV